MLVNLFCLNNFIVFLEFFILMKIIITKLFINIIIYFKIRMLQILSFEYSLDF